MGYYGGSEKQELQLASDEYSRRPRWVGGTVNGAG